jgi:LL-diaminopimelate aminotransferase
LKLNNILSNISEYYFQRLDEMKSKLVNAGTQLVDLSIGDPDLPVDEKIIKALKESLSVKDFNKYPPYEGIKELKHQIIKYYEEVYSVHLTLDEVIILIGSKEGINNIIPAVCDVGDYSIIPQPAYPVYETCCTLWGVRTYKLPLLEKNDYLPSFKNIPQEVINKCKLMVLNYPNNPTGATATKEFYKEAIEFCYKNNIVLYNDAAYNEIIEENAQPLSLLSFDYKKQCIEFGTFSKTYSMTGFRIGYAVGNSDVINALLKVKSNVDSGQFLPIQYAACEALNLNRDFVMRVRKVYDERRIAAEKKLIECGINFFKPKGTFYIWCRVPKNFTTDEYCMSLLSKHGIIVTPGYNFGSMYNEHFRIALTKDTKIITSALEKIKKNI